MPYTPFLDGFIDWNYLAILLTVSLMGCLGGAYFIVITEVTYKRQPLWWRFGLTTGLFVLMIALSLHVLIYV